MPSTDLGSPLHLPSESGATACPDPPEQFDDNIEPPPPVDTHANMTQGSDTYVSNCILLMHRYPPASHRPMEQIEILSQAAATSDAFVVLPEVLILDSKNMPQVRNDLIRERGVLFGKKLK